MTRKKVIKEYIMPACRHMWNDKICKEIEETLREPQGEWIPVSERLPEEGKFVMASIEYGVYPETRYTKEYGWEWAYEAGTDYWRELKDVLAWMPLPEPYKVESEET